MALKNDYYLKKCFMFKIRIMSQIELFNKGTIEKISRIAEGTYGIVYEGKHISTGLPVAVKRFKVDSNTNFVGCVKELDFLVRLKGHPFIINLLGISKGSPFGIGGKDSPLRIENLSFLDDRLYLISEQGAYDGSNLRGISISYFKMIMVQSLLGLEYMHGHGVIHRDIKPSNLLWFRDGVERSIKFCDFGISKMYTRQESNSCFVVTPIYRAPELYFNMSDYDYSSDIWSLGCTFYEILKGESFIHHKIYEGTDRDKKMVREILNRSPELPSETFLQLAQKSMVYNFPKYIMGPRLYTWDTMLNLSSDKIKEFGGLYNEFKNLLNSMMKIDPSRRISAGQALNHPFFKEYNTYISEVRKIYPVYDETYFNPKIKIYNCEERQWVTWLISHFYYGQQEVEFGKRKFDWFQMRILYHTISMYDRFLNYYFETGMNQTLKQNLESSTFCFLVCLYMNIKYFLTILEPCKFEKLLDEKYRNPTDIKRAEDFEWFMLQTVLNFKLYQPTLYEAADYFNIQLTPQQSINLLSLYCTIDTENLNLTDLFAKLAPSANIEIKTYIKTGNISPPPVSQSPPPLISSPVPSPIGPIDNKLINSINNILDKVVPQYIPTVGIKPIHDNILPSAVNLKHVNIGLQTAQGKYGDIDINAMFKNLKLDGIATK